MYKSGHTVEYLGNLIESLPAFFSSELLQPQFTSSLTKEVKLHLVYLTQGIVSLLKTKTFIFVCNAFILDGRNVFQTTYKLTTMSACSSISGNSGSRNDEGSSQLNRNTMEKNSWYSPAKASRRASSRSRPGIQRSDHSSASVQQLELDDCASFHSFSSHATTSTATTASKSLSRKHSIHPLKPCASAHGNSFLDLNKSYHVGCDTSSIHTSPTRSSSSYNSRNKSVHFAPESENLYIPVPNLDETTTEEIDGRWFSTTEYEQQRSSFKGLVKLMEQELMRQSEETSTPAVEITASSFTSVIKKFEGARGLEHRTNDGTKIILHRRQNSIQAVLREQERQRNDQQAVWNQTASIATAYSMETIVSVLDAVERAVYDAKEADIVVSDPKLFELISPKSRRKSSTISIPRGAPLSDGPRLPRVSSKTSISDSLHSLSSPTKRGYQPRPLPKRQPSSASTMLQRLSNHRRPQESTGKESSNLMFGKKSSHSSKTSRATSVTLV